MFEKLKQKMESMRDAMQDIAVDKLPNKVPDHIQKERIAICHSCDKLYKPTATCKLCGCFMEVKTWMPSQECPIKKWNKL